MGPTPQRATQPVCARPQGVLYQLSVATHNGSSWNSFRKYLEATNVEVVLGQEMRLTTSQIPAVSEWAKLQGWKSLWAPAQPSLVGGPSSGGVAIFARERLGLQDILGPTAPESRFKCGILEVPGDGAIMLDFVYLHDGKAMDSSNLSILVAFTSYASAMGSPWMLGGDFQATLEETVGYRLV